MERPIYPHAVLRCVGQSPAALDRVALSLDAGGPATSDRYALTLPEAERIALALLDAVAVQRYRALRATVHSPMSSDIPNCDVSPHEGHAQ